ncbi:MAG: thymidylate synthase (FAD) [Rhodospirillaceae bacterium]|nr:thymidylate synthase (FAD) [Rhodospirillaceae bacterium]|tara:strand:- start:879 stop:1526 length:648 start_codon:yes stop_codon:yes gene_type:complete
MSKVTLIHSTKDGDELIAYMARVSNPTNQDNKDSSKLIKYLIKHKHWSPFEMVNMCVEINTTRSISAQILRHRSFSFQEFSQRYASVEELELPTPPNLRLQDPKNRQNSIEDTRLLDKEQLEYVIRSNYIQTYNLYKNMLAAGIAKECAREVLPMGTPTRLYMNGTLRSWIHYVDLRTANGTQKEHRDIAEACKQLIKTQFPLTYEVISGYSYSI